MIKNILKTRTIGRIISGVSILMICSIIAMTNIQSNALWFEKVYKGEILCSTQININWVNCNWFSNNFAPAGLNMRQLICLSYGSTTKAWTGTAEYGEGSGVPYTATAKIKCYTWVKR